MHTIHLALEHSNPLFKSIMMLQEHHFVLKVLRLLFVDITPSTPVNLACILFTTSHFTKSTGLVFIVFAVPKRLTSVVPPAVIALPCNAPRANLLQCFESLRCACQCFHMRSASTHEERKKDRQVQVKSQIPTNVWGRHYHTRAAALNHLKAHTGNLRRRLGHRPIIHPAVMIQSS